MPGFLTPRDVHVDKPLTDLSVAYMQSREDFVATRAFSVVPSDQQSNKYFVWDREHHLRARMQKRAPGQHATTGGMKLSTDNYFCEVWGYREALDRQTRSNQDAGLNLEGGHVDSVTLQAMLRMELEWVSNYFGAGVWSNDFEGVAAGPGAGQFLQWDAEASTPILDVKTAKRSVQRATGFKPNIAVVDPDTFDVLTEHPSIVDKIRVNIPADVSADVLKRLKRQLLTAELELEELLVAEGVVNTEPDGSATDGTDFIMPNGLLLAYRPQRPGIKTPAAGYTFTWSGLTGAGDQGTRILRYPEEPHFDWFEIEAAFDYKVVSPQLAAFFATPIGG